MKNLEAKAQVIRQAHQEGGIILNNVWDAMTTKLATRADAKFIATTSAGIAWDNGYSNGEDVTFRVMLTSLRAIVRATDLPVSADIDEVFRGQSLSKNEVVKAIREVGVAGINVGDSEHAKQLDLAAGAERIKELRVAADSQEYPIFITAQIDSLYLGNDESTSNIVARAKAYVDAGAECIYIPGLTDLAQAKELVQEIPVPVGAMYSPDGPSCQEFFDAGVKRVSSDFLHAENAYGYILDKMKQFSSTGELNLEADAVAKVGKLQ